MFELFLVSSLEKILYSDNPAPQALSLSAFQGESCSWQLAYRSSGADAGQTRVFFAVSAEGCDVTLRQVCHVPVRLAAYADSDDGYIGKQPGLYPDLLKPLSPAGQWLCPGRPETLWAEASAEKPGTWPVTVTMTGEDGQTLASCTVTLTVLSGRLPEQKLIRTQWFHCDCLAGYYGVEVFSEAHWRIIESFLRCAVRRGINAILTPIHTPPLDTRAGGERPTVQLVGIRKDEDGYHFDFTLLERWIGLCLACGVRYFEMAHLFTQWGAAHAPKIVAEVGGRQERIFGWETDAASPVYRDFLAAYIPAVRRVFAAHGLEDRTIWHISDEPSEAVLEHYRAARHQVEDLLSGCRIMDALSSFAFWQQGVVQHPIVATNHMEPFLEAGVPGLWAYYCCGQHRDVSNMFIAMPSARNRAIGVQLYLYGIEGFLQWGFNFYNAEYSDYAIDPYATADADGWVPAGDPFQVYPGRDGTPEESIRLLVTDEALRDLRALQWLEALRGREQVVGLIQDGLSEPVTFTRYPAEAAYYLRLRRRVNEAIAECN